MGVQIPQSPLNMLKSFAFWLIIGLISVIISFSFFLGLFLGYFVSKLYIDKFFGKRIGKLKLGPIYIPLGKYRIHLHHWFYPFFILGVGFLTNAFFIKFYSVVGFLIGISIHDLLSDKKWYKVLISKDAVNR